MDLTIEQIRLLAEQERSMDSGQTPFVRVPGSTQRMSVMPEVMEELGLVSGQTVSDMIVVAIMQAQIGVLKAQIAMRDAGIT